MMRRHIFGSLLAGLVATAPSAATATEICAYVGAGCPDQSCHGSEKLDSFQNWLGLPIRHVVDFANGASWDAIVQATNDKATYWRAHRPGTELVLAVAMLPSAGTGSLDEGAQGAYDNTFLKIAKTLVNAGQGGAELRLGWEFNGNWYAWKASQDPQAFVRYWQRIVAAMRTVRGSNFRFNWNPSIDGHTDLNQTYPGDAYVDAIGLDLYNDGSSQALPEQRWQQYADQPFGLRWLAEFARVHRKPLDVPEWGTGIPLPSRPSVGGGDDPFFARHALAWFGRNNVAYACYFNFNPPRAPQTMLSSVPKSAEVILKDVRLRKAYHPPPP